MRNAGSTKAAQRRDTMQKKLRTKLEMLQEKGAEHFREVEPSEIRKLMNMYPHLCFTGTLST